MEKKSNKNEHEVNIKDYDYLTILGQGNHVNYTGSFGEVRLVKKKNTNKYSCVKIMKKEELIKSQQVDHIAN
jgi:serine/threonine protein kinase